MSRGSCGGVGPGTTVGWVGFVLFLARVSVLVRFSVNSWVGRKLFFFFFLFRVEDRNIAARLLSSRAEVTQRKYCPLVR